MDKIITLRQKYTLEIREGGYNTIVYDIRKADVMERGESPRQQTAAVMRSGVSRKPLQPRL